MIEYDDLHVVRRLVHPFTVCVPQEDEPIGPEGESVNERWDAGEMGCGQLVFELHLRMKRLRAGERLEVVARDPGAPTDLPAWCRMTGNTLVSAQHPVYVLERKPE